MTRAFVALILSLTVSASAVAQPASDTGDWPKRVIRLIVTAAAGSAGDTVCRIVAQKLSERLGQQFVFDNRPAAGGTVATEAEKNMIWDAIKTVPTWQQEVVADIQVTGAGAAGAAGPAAKTYTVKPGDTLGAIAKAHLGNAGAYMKIFELNKDQLTDPDKIKPGQVLKLP